MRKVLALLVGSLCGTLASADSSSSTSTSSALKTAPTDAVTKQPIRSSGCSHDASKSLAQPGGPSKRIKFGSRYLRLTLPQNYDPDVPAPLIIAFHDAGSTARQLEQTSLLSHAHYNRDAVVAYPEAALEGRWMSDAQPPKNIDDVDFTATLMARLKARLCVDEDRVFAAGLGTGGGMAHLLACNAETSGKISAYAVVNGNILTGLDQNYGPKDVKDPARLIWETCRPERKGPTRIMVIHSENNTVYDYYGAEKYKGRKRIGAVQWLVDWAHMNKCGNGLEMPERWAEKSEKLFKTRLSQGYIFEGWVENGTVTKAMYNCWHGDEGKPQAEEDMPPEVQGQMESRTSKWKMGGTTKTASAETGAETAATAADAGKEDGEAEKVKVPFIKMNNDAHMQALDEEEADVDAFITKLRDSVILEHYYLRKYGHGWPRVKRASVQEPVEPVPVKETDEARTLTSPSSSFTWETLTAPPEAPLDLSFDKDVFTFHYGFDDPDPEVVAFDSTHRVLDWFRMFRYSDPSPVAPRDDLGLTEVESNVLQNMVRDIKRKIAAVERERELEGDKEGEREEVPEKPGESSEERKGKDEL